MKLTFLKDDIMYVAFSSNVGSNCVMSLHSKDVETIETIVLFKSYFVFNLHSRFTFFRSGLS